MNNLNNVPEGVTVDLYKDGTGLVDIAGVHCFEFECREDGQFLVDLLSRIEAADKLVEQRRHHDLYQDLFRRYHRLCMDYGDKTVKAEAQKIYDYADSRIANQVRPSLKEQS